MGTEIRQAMSNALKVFDLLLMVLSLGAANLPVLIRSGPINFTHFLSLRIKLENILVLLALLWVWNFVFTLFGLYGSKRMSSRIGELADVIKATAVGSLVMVAAGSVLKLNMLTPSFVCLFWLFATAVDAASRLVLRTWLRHVRTQGRNSRNMLIVGTNHRAVEFARTIQSQPELGYRILGFCDDKWDGLGELPKHTFSVLCDLATLPVFLRRNVVDEVVLGLPIRSFHLHTCQIADLCEQQGIILRMLPDLFNLRNTRPKAEELDGTAFITHYTTLTEGGPLLAKRIFDLAVALTLFTILAPFLLIAAVLIKLTSPGPVLFIQKRVGLNKRMFDIYKFRTMVVNAESKIKEIEHLNEVSGPVFKIKDDPRLTPIGKLLRQTSIDELPQLFNVIKGDMSLVGPRPWQLRDYELFNNACEDWQRRRFSVRPGVTCLWQVNGRSSVSFERWMELDLQYVQKWSFWLDLQILAKTIPAVLKGSGAA
jgi:exopolysaccharide biosynthesis polyprenyl glycosylphosphotransferase